jgi:outer membrane protein, heavy metal efflux system
MVVQFVAALFLVANAAEHTGSSETRTTLSFDQALGLSDDGVTVKASQQAADIKASTNRQIARVNLNPNIQLQAGPRIYPSSAREPEVVLQILQPWNGNGYLDARRKSASHEHGLLQAHARLVALSQRLDVAHLWMRLWTAQRELEILKRMQTVASDLAGWVARARSAGAAIEIEAKEAEMHVVDLALQVVEMEGTVHDLSLELSRRLGWLPTGRIETIGELPVAPVPGSEARDRYVERAGELPEARAAAMQARANRAHVVEQKAMAGWTYALGANVEHDAPGGLIVSGLLQLTPPLFDRGERNLGSAQASAIDSDGQATSAILAAKNAIALAFHEVEHSGEILNLVQERVLPTATHIWELRRKQFELGGATVVDTLESQQVVVNAELRRNGAISQHAWARVKLWLLLLAIEDGGSGLGKR